MRNNSNETNREKSKKIKKMLSIGIIGLFIIVFLIFDYCYTENESFRKWCDKNIFRKEVLSEDTTFIEIDSNNIKPYAYDGNIAILKQNQFIVYNQSGKEKYSLDIKVSNPIFESNDKYICVAEKDGEELYLVKDRNILWKNTVEGKITDVRVNKDGYVVVTISGTTYKTIIVTYDENGTELFKMYLSEATVVDAEISKDNKFLAIAEANFEGIVVESTIKIISMDEAKKNGNSSVVHTHVAERDDLIIDIKYDEKNNLVCMYDEHIDIIKDNQNKELMNFNNENIAFSDINLQNKCIKISADTGILTIVDTITEKTKTYNLEEIPKAVYTYEDMIGINFGTEILFINTSGWLEKDYKAEKEIQNIVMCNNVAGIIYKNKIELISL